MQNDKNTMIRIARMLLEMVESILEELEDEDHENTRAEFHVEESMVAREEPTATGIVVEEIYNLLRRAPKPVHKTVLAEYARRLGYDIDAEDLVELLSKDKRFRHNRKGAWTVATAE